jgi:hypothetical protein
MRRSVRKINDPDAPKTIKIINNTEKDQPGVKIADLDRVKGASQFTNFGDYALSQKLKTAGKKK